MSRKGRLKNDLELACQIYWGEYVDPETCNLKDTNTPEDQIISKDTLSKLSEEAKVLAEVLIALPDEMFLGTGRVIKKELIKYMKVTFNWTAEKTNIVQDELTTMLR